MKWISIRLPCTWFHWSYTNCSLCEYNVQRLMLCTVRRTIIGKLVNRFSFLLAWYSKHSDADIPIQNGARTIYANNGAVLICNMKFSLPLLYGTVMEFNVYYHLARSRFISSIEHIGLVRTSTIYSEIHIFYVNPSMVLLVLTHVDARKIQQIKGDKQRTRVCLNENANSNLEVMLSGRGL